MKKIFKVLSLFVMVFAVMTLASCAPKDAAAGREKLEKKEYVVVTDGTVIPAALKLAKVEGVQTVLTATSKDGKESLVAVLFEKSSQAKDSFDKLSDYAKKNGNYTDVKRTGKWLYYGTDNAMKDFA